MDSLPGPRRASAPLDGRAVERLEVKPLRMTDFTAAAGIADPVACVKGYTAWGGILRYWELAEEPDPRHHRAWCWLGDSASATPSHLIRQIVRAAEHLRVPETTPFASDSTRSNRTGSRILIFRFPEPIGPGRPQNPQPT